MKLTDLLAETLAELGVTNAFGVQGGAVVHIFDSLERSSVSVTYSVYEQSAALAAVAASRVSEVPQLCVVTTGPGGTNAITGLLSAWQDSVPTIFISGQTRLSHVSYGTRKRQVGSQEAPILDLVRPITKRATLVRSADEIESVIAASHGMSLSGRPGPVWIDIPVDLQWASIDKCDLETGLETCPTFVGDEGTLTGIRQLLRESRKPLLWLGGGAKRHREALRQLIETTGIPFVTTWQTKHLLGVSETYDLGVVGPFGQRGANKATYDADLLIAVGSHFGVNHTTSNFKAFCPQAKKIIVDIDANELQDLLVEVDLVLQADAGEFIEWLRNEDVGGKAWALDDRIRYRLADSIESQKKEFQKVPASHVNSNLFLSMLFCESMEAYDVVIDGGGTALYAGWQANYGSGLNVLVGSSAISSMGTAMAEAVGVQAVSDSVKTFIIIGDGSFWMSLQDLPPLGWLDRPVIVIVINNEGYLAIRQTQKQFLEGRYHGTSSDGGLPFPEIAPIVKGLGFTTLKVTGMNVEPAIRQIREHTEGVLVVELMSPADQELLFSQVFQSNHDGTKTPLPLSTMGPILHE